jgi:hypothetical protein
MPGYFMHVPSMVVTQEQARITMIVHHLQRSDREERIRSSDYKFFTT